MKKLFLILLIFGFSTPAHSQQTDENINTKIDVEYFWNQIKKTREIKYGVDKHWNKNMDYCSYFAENIALTKGEGLVMSKLVKYANKCHHTLNFMTKYLLEKK